MKLISGIELYELGIINPILDKESVLDSVAKIKFISPNFSLLLFLIILNVSLDTYPHLILSFPSKNA